MSKHIPAESIPPVFASNKWTVQMKGEKWKMERKKTMGEMQKMVAGFAESHQMSREPWVRFLDLSSEVGELSKELLKASDYGAKRAEPTPTMEEELGDCVFSLLCLADSLGLDAAAALEGSLKKYELRFQTTGKIGSGR